MTTRTPLPTLMRSSSRRKPPRSCLGLVCLLACSPEPPPELPDLPMDETGASPSLDLRSLPMRIQLPATNLPRGNPYSAEMPVERVEPADDTGLLRATLPFTPPSAAHRFAPAGMRVVADGAELPYRPGRPGPRRTGWTISEGELYLRTGADQPPERLVVHHPRLAAQVDQLDLATSGRSPEEQVQQRLTLGEITRPGLVLPAPGHIEWTLTIPPGGQLRAHLAMRPVPMPEAVSDGADVVLELVQEGGAEEIDRMVVPGRRPAFEPWTVDLSEHAGEELRLRLRTTPRQSSDYDYVFIGSPTISGKATGEPRHVVVIGLDTTRPDHLMSYGYHRPTSPEIQAFANESMVFEQAWAPAPRTRPSFRTATTGRRPLDAVGAMNIGEVLDEVGFETAGMVANVHLHPRFGFDRGFDMWWLDTSAKAHHQVDRALEWLEERREQDTYLFLHIMDPHLLYVAPRGYFERFVETPDPDLPDRFTRGQVYRWMREGQIDERRRAHIEARYDGEIAYTSAQLGRLFDGLDHLGGRSLVILHSDHGEEFWEHGAFEHNRSLYEELVHAVLMVRTPGGSPGRVNTPATLADIAPTLYDYLGLEQPPPSDGRSLRPLIEGSADADTESWKRPLPVGYLRYGHERWGVVWQGHKYILHTHDGREELYDLRRDPGEQQNLAESSDLRPYHQALALAHGAPVGPGWRLRLRAPAGQVLHLDLPEPSLAAGVFDPESLTAHPVNQAWGEVPPVQPEEVAQVERSQDGRSLRITAGPRGHGLLYVLFEEQVEVGGQVRLGEAEPEPLVAVTPERARWTSAGRSLDARAGTVIIPPPDEADRMLGGPEASSDELELLQALGYVGE